VDWISLRIGTSGGLLWWIFGFHKTSMISSRIAAQLADSQEWFSFVKLVKF
jgi:hypothetical protein